METLLKQDIPSFLKDSAYLKSLLNNEPFPETGIDVPTGCAKKDLSVNSASNLTELLQTLRFWMAPEVLETCGDFLVFAFDMENQAILSECAIEYEVTIPLVQRIEAIVSSSPVDRVKQAISYGYVFVLRFVYDELKCEIDGGSLMAVEADQIQCLEYFHSRGEPLTLELAGAAAKANSLQCLMYIHDFGGVCDFSTLLSAATHGSLECVQFLVKNGAPILPKNLDKMLRNASRAGHLPVVEYLWDACSDLRTPSSEGRVCYPAASKGHLALLQFAHARSFAVFSSPPSSAASLIACASQSGSLPCVEYLYSVGQRGNAEAVRAAAGAGCAPLIRFLLERNCPIDPTEHIGEQMLRKKKVSFEEAKVLFEMGVPWDARTMAAFAGTGCIEGMQYLRERGCPWDERTCGRAARGGHLECLSYVHENGCPWIEAVSIQPHFELSIVEDAAFAPTLDCLKYVVEQGAPLYCEAVIQALQVRSLPAVQYLLSVGCPLDARACAIATKSSDKTATEDIVFLRLLREHNCPWDATACWAAAVKGDVDCLRFAHENGCPWDATTCAAAAGATDAAITGSLECLQYAHINGCPWDEATCAGAASIKNFEILKYARDHGCPWDARTCAAAAGCHYFLIDQVRLAEAEALSFLKFVREQGCPWDQRTFRKADSRAIYDYAVENGCPGAQQSVYHDPAFSGEDHFDEMMHMMGHY